MAQAGDRVPLDTLKSLWAVVLTIVWTDGSLLLSGTDPGNGGKKMTTEIRRFYGVYEVYVDGVFVESFCALWAAKEYVAKLGA